MSPYYSPKGGLPSQTAMMTDRAVFKDAYALIPRGVMSDIVTSNLPFWQGHTGVDPCAPDVWLCRDFCAVYC